MRKNKRIFTHYLLHKGKVYEDVILERVDNNINIFPYKYEIANTIFIPGIVVICNEISSDIHICALTILYNSNQKLRHRAHKINCYFIENNLYSEQNVECGVLYQDADTLKYSFFECI